MLLVLQNQLIEHIEIQRCGRAFGPAQGAGVRLLRQRLDGLGQRLRGCFSLGASTRMAWSRTVRCSTQRALYNLPVRKLHARGAAGRRTVCPAELLAPQEHVALLGAGRLAVKFAAGRIEGKADAPLRACAHQRRGGALVGKQRSFPACAAENARRRPPRAAQQRFRPPGPDTDPPR